MLNPASFFSRTQEVMLAMDEVGKLRWMRVIAELTKSAAQLCPLSMGVAYIEMMQKLSRQVWGWGWVSWRG